MLEQIIYSWSPEVKVMIAATLIFGIIIGVVTVIGLIMVLEKTPEEGEQVAPRRLLSPRKHRRESETRAALQARMMVASGAFQTITRR